MKPTFLNRPKPVKVAMLHSANPSEVIALARTAIYDGADAFGIQLEKFTAENRTDAMYKKMFAPLGDLPLYVTNYRSGQSASHTDEERAAELLHALHCGATLLDVMGDLYDPSPLQMTKNPDAIARQKAFIDQIHAEGGEVLMSCHTSCYLPPEQVLEIAQEQKSRGADIIKIVTEAHSEEQQAENLRAISLMKRELGAPFLFLCNGRYHKIQRMIGPMLGVCMWLCVVEYNSAVTPTQPLLRAVTEVERNFDYTLPRG